MLTLTWTQLIVVLVVVVLVVRYYVGEYTSAALKHRITFEIDKISLDRAHGEIAALDNRVRTLIEDAACYNEIAARQK